MPDHSLLRPAATAVVLALATAACGSGGDGETEAAAEIAEPIVATYDGGAYVIDGETLDVAADIEFDGFTRVNPAGDGRHVLVSTSSGFAVLDAAAGELTGAEFPAEEPGHVVHHAGHTVLFADGTGEVTTVESDEFGAESPAAESFTTDSPHHGVAVRLSDGSMLVTLGDEDERPGVQVLDADGGEIARNEDCPGVHGEATAADEAVAIGCEDGMLIYRDGEFTKVDSPDDYGRIGNQAGSEASRYVLGDYKTDPDAELERPERVSLVDTSTGDLELVDLGTSYSFRSLARGPHGEALVLGTDGALHVIHPESGEVTDTWPVIDSWEEPVEWQEPRPTLFVRGHTAYVTDPAQRMLYAVHVESGEVEAEVELDAAPNELTGVAVEEDDDAHVEDGENGHEEEHDHEE